MLFSCFVVTCFAADSRSEKPDFPRLRNERLQVVADIDGLKGELRRIDDTVKGLPLSAEIDGYLKRAQKAVTDIGGELAKEQKQRIPNKNLLDRLTSDLRFSQSDVLRYQADVERKKNAEKESERFQAALKAKEKELFEIESKISAALGRDVVAQEFKSQISLYFAVLLGFMILCFFGVAFYDEKVRNTIFSGQSGMQFVTLFSLIIAIILFGITGILEDKELAALLGGLSGYILGRYNQNDKLIDFVNPTAMPPIDSPTASPNVPTVNPPQTFNVHKTRT